MHSPSVAAVLFLIPGAGEPQQQVVIYGDINYPPYSFAEEGQPRGIYTDVLRSVFARMPGYDVTIKMIPWKRGLQYVQDGHGVALFPPYYVKEREPWMMLSEPILEEQVVPFGNEENLEGKSDWPGDFFGHRIGLNGGYDVGAMGSNGVVGEMKASEQIRAIARQQAR